MKPSWEDAPEWAQWLAMDADRTWRFFAEKPRACGVLRYWAGGGSAVRASGVAAHWGHTLEPRPAQPAPEMPSLDELIWVCQLVKWYSSPGHKHYDNAEATRAKLRAVKEDWA